MPKNNQRTGKEIMQEKRAQVKYRLPKQKDDKKVAQNTQESMQEKQQGTKQESRQEKWRSTKLKGMRKQQQGAKQERM